MIDEYFELKALKEKLNKIKYLLFDKESGLPFIVNEKETIKKIKNIIKEKEKKRVYGRNIY